MPKHYKKHKKNKKHNKQYKGGNVWGTLKTIGGTALNLLPLLALGRVEHHPKVKKHFKGGVQLASAPAPI